MHGSRIAPVITPNELTNIGTQREKTPCRRIGKKLAHSEICDAIRANTLSFFRRPAMNAFVHSFSCANKNKLCFFRMIRFRECVCVVRRVFLRSLLVFTVLDIRRWKRQWHNNRNAVAVFIPKFICRVCFLCFSHTDRRCYGLQIGAFLWGFSTILSSHKYSFARFFFHVNSLDIFHCDCYLLLFLRFRRNR